MKSHRRLVALATCLALAAPGAAAAQDAGAAKRFRKLAKPILADHKAAVAEAVAEIVATLEQFGDDIEAGSWNAALVEGLRVSLEAQSEAVYQAMITAAGSGSGSAVALLDEANGGDPNDGVFAATFYAGSGGVYDDFVADLLATTVRAYKKVDKAAAALEKRAAASDIGLTVVIPPPPPAHNFSKAPNEEITSATGASRATIDYVVAGSRLDQTGDGILIVGGHADQGDAVPVTLGLFASLGGPDFEEVFGPSAVVDRRWSLLVDDAGSGLPEGNFILSLRKGPTFLLDAVVGVR